MLFLSPAPASFTKKTQNCNGLRGKACICDAKAVLGCNHAANEHAWNEGCPCDARTPCPACQPARSPAPAALQGYVLQTQPAALPRECHALARREHWASCMVHYQGINQGSTSALPWHYQCMTYVLPWQHLHITRGSPGRYHGITCASPGHHLCITRG